MEQNTAHTVNIGSIGGVHRTTFSLNRTTADNQTVMASYSIYTPAPLSQRMPSSPAVFLLNGFNVQSSLYSRLIREVLGWCLG